ncbi:DUF4381 domain-containing protein [Zhongshania arctica]|uniref:DUF4381 domain-containing protein n=1 Tax=Zhongshania arctica TaxID=3238302 RepID=A0ABV3TZV4_9GAMM|tara:strand:- start:768 stop:1283 length:516 start_codon:yes stop_codon:yes gene_type:complete
MNSNSQVPMMPASGQNSPLDQLADIHLPPAIAAFPWAPGWWLLLGLLLIVMLAGFLWLRQRRRKHAFRRAALTELSELVAIEKDAEFAQQLNQLLRRVSLHSFSNDNIAGLSGDKWTNFLYQSCGDKPAFSDGILETLFATAYQPAATPLARDVLIAQSKTWIRRHRSSHV